MRVRCQVCDFEGELLPQGVVKEDCFIDFMSMEKIVMCYCPECKQFSRVMLIGGIYGMPPVED